MLVSLLALLAAAVPVPSSSAAPSGPGGWQSVASDPILPSSDHTATMLKDGRVLVVGGQTCGLSCSFHDVGVNSAELYDPVTSHWTSTGSTAVAREYHTATLLRDGRVLIAGGFLNVGPGDATPAAEIYSPTTGRWIAVASMHVGRLGHTATVLASGKVLVAGGLSRSPTALVWDDSAELFDPATTSWTSAGRMNVPRAEHTATLLPDGTVFVAGGRNTTGGRRPPSNTVALNTAEVYDPATGGWKLASHLLHTPRAEHTATLLTNGTVLLVGGVVTYYHGGTSDPTESVDLYDPVKGTFSALPKLPQPRSAHTATLLSDGRILIAGGIRLGDNVRSGLSHHEAAAPELFDATAGLWVPVAPMVADPSTHGERGLIEYLLAGRHTATLLTTGRVLVVGGDGGTHAAQLFDPAGGPVGAGGPSSSPGFLVAVGGIAAVAVVLVGLAILWARRRSRSQW